MRTALIGLATHYLIATVVVSVYYFASRKISVLRTRPVIMGALYGMAVWGTMNFVVLPLSAAGPPKFTARASLLHRHSDRGNDNETARLIGKSSAFSPLRGEKVAEGRMRG
jgi:hypothetical protein